MKWDDVIKKCWKNFEKADEEGEFKDISYVDESNRIYHLLALGDCRDSYDEAVYDVVSDIFYELVKGKVRKHQREKSVSKKPTKVKPKFANYWNVKKGY